VQILSMHFDLWLVAALLAFSVGVTLLANWLVTRRLVFLSVGEGVASLVWLALVFVASLYAARYAERFAAAYLIYGLVILGLSLLRAWLYQRSATPPMPIDWPGRVRRLTYPVGALVVYLTWCWLLRRSAQPLLLLPLGFGALLPDLPPSLRAKRSNPLWEAGHTPAAAAALALVTSPLILLVGAAAWRLFLLGFLCHLALDLFRSPGVRLLWPLRTQAYQVHVAEQTAERWLPLGLALAALVLVLTVEFGPVPTPAAPAPSYEQTVARYYSLRGRNRVFAQIEGSWQTSGRRWGGYFEVLNASDESFLILDNFTGHIFRAGRSPEDDFYLSSISLAVGDAVRVKPVEVHLADQPLAEALSVLYQMQRETGLLTIFVSGDVRTAASLPLDEAQDRLPKIQSGEPGQYTLHYLTAAELIALAGVPVETADLVIFATYASPAVGPTVTPLPMPQVAP
jgi:membrane-bound metal-dependent hydrolase YbcI (DUF457 family)